MHILIIPSETYIPPDNPLLGIFQQMQARALEKSGLQIGVISLEFLQIKNLLKGRFDRPISITITHDDGIVIFRFKSWNWSPFYNRGKSFIWVHGGMFLFNKYVENYGTPDIIHAHNAYRAGLLAAAIKKKYSIPYVITEHSSSYAHGLIPKSDLNDIRTCYRTANRCIMVSQSLGKDVEELLGSWVQPYECIPNLLDEFFENSNNRISSSENSKDGIFKFLSVGALIKEKGQAILLKAFAQFFRNTNTQIRIAGDGPLKSDLQKLAIELEIADQTNFLGQINREQLLQEMQKCNALVHPSYYETFGVVIIEALSCGKPVISTKCGGPESLVNNKNGILVPVGDINSLGEAMVYLKNNSSQYNKNWIRDDCLRKYGSKSISNSLIKVYNEVLS